MHTLRPFFRGTNESLFDACVMHKDISIKLSCKGRLLHFCWLVGRIPLGPDWIFLLPVTYSDARGPDHAQSIAGSTYVAQKLKRVRNIGV